MESNNGEKAKLAGKLLAIMKGIGRIEKDKEVTAGQRFKYLSEEAKKTIAQPLFIEHGVLPVPSDMELLDTRPTAAVPQLQKFSQKVRGLPEADEARKLVAPYTRDRGYLSLVKIAGTIEKLRAAEKLSKPQSARTVAAMKKALKGIVDAGKSPPGVLAQAQSELDGLP